MLADQGGSNVYNQTFTIKTMRSDFGNIADTSIANNDIFLSLSAVEMVYIPYGGYYLGDGATSNRLGDSGGNPIAVNSEDALNVYPVTAGSEGEAKSLPATYPKGYKGFYCMKYEVSQEQYVGFLNNLTRDQQKERIGNSLDELKVGEYVFGDKSRPSYRNGICVLANPSDKPAVFGCNLNPAEPYFGEDDGKCIACNYLTPADMLAYCDYACLRPMSELEYEKACRRPYPQAALAGEFVWNSASGVNGLNAKRDLLNVGKVSEKPSSSVTNVNYDNPDFGPVRCATFGTSSSTQTQAGATFWGLMEMSGNVAELCYSVDAAAFNTSDIYASHGNGEIADAVTAWATTPASFIAKGGDFTSFQNAELMISDRTRVNVSDVRDSTMGFRAVHTFGSSSGVVNPGIIKVAAMNCPGEEISVSDSVQASAMWNGVAMYTKISYVWYVKEGAAGTWSLIPNEVGAELQNYEPLSGAGITVRFKRKAVSSLGEAETSEISTIVPNMSIIFTPATSKLDACGPGTVVVKVADLSAKPTFTWTTETGTKTGASYTPAYTDFNAGTSASGNVEVTCLAEWSGCSNTDTLTVAVTALQPKLSFSCNSTFTDSRDGQTYPTKKIGTQCWMIKNMNIGIRVAGTDYTTHQRAGIQKICYYDDESYCTTYGGLYNWAEAVNGENTGTGAATTATAYNKKCVVDGSPNTQGICPDGWHIPSDAEFKTLEMALDPPLTQAQADATGWRGSDQGRKLKSIDLWTVNASTSGTNTSFCDGRPGGLRSYSGGTFNYVGTHGYWWSSSEDSSSYAWRRLLVYSRATVSRYDDNKSYGMSIRCILN
jgi:uncharacterized protein (TIGR02145 family)